jgi:murein DD-endopeptidase MepM/ murein hydrolase activator NlpD
MTRFFASLLLLAGPLAAAPLDLRLPTANQHLFTGEMDQFYMYVQRDFEGTSTKPWQAGTYGFVRTAQRINGEILLTKFHEGIDISPTSRDALGNPLDPVSSIAAGRVAYVNPAAGGSNYGKYIVVEHTWENSAVLSLYAHLSEITCKPGDPVSAGTVIGKMGFTGAGIDRTRAHCHLELGMLMNTHFAEWQKKCGKPPDVHGNYNGMNITGAEVSRFFLEQKAHPELQFSQFIATTPVYFKVTVPAHGTPDFVSRYPWIGHGQVNGAASWEISFSATGLPVAFTASSRVVSAPAVTAVRPSKVPHRYLTRGLISGEGNQATLSNSGKQLISLLTEEFPITQ